MSNHQLQSEIDDILIEFGNALYWLDIAGYDNLKSVKELRKIRKEFVKSIFSIIKNIREEAEREMIEKIDKFVRDMLFKTDTSTREYELNMKEWKIILIL